jgi:Zn-dependent peptidase ImmA (M78 family)
VTSNNISSAVSSALSMRAKFCMELQEIQPLAVSVTKLINFISKETGVNVEIKTVHAKKGGLRGFLIRQTNNRAIILIADENVNTECWERFTLVKEVSHLFLNGDEHFNTSIRLKADGLVSGEIEDEHLSMESGAVLAAIELLIPIEFEGTIAHMSNVEKMSSLRIAEYFKVPLLYMEYRMRQA